MKLDVFIVEKLQSTQVHEIKYDVLYAGHDVKLTGCFEKPE